MIAAAFKWFSVDPYQSNAKPVYLFLVSSVMTRVKDPQASFLEAEVPI